MTTGRENVRDYRIPNLALDQRYDIRENLEIIIHGTRRHTEGWERLLRLCCGDEGVPVVLCWFLTVLWL